MPKAVVPQRGIERRRQLLDGCHQRLRDVLPAVGAVSPARIRSLYKFPPTHAFSAPRTAATNARSLAGSFRPGSASTPLQTSTAQGWSARIAPSTFSGVNPPETTTGY